MSARFSVRRHLVAGAVIGLQLLSASSSSAEESSSSSAASSTAASVQSSQEQRAFSSAEPAGNGSLLVEQKTVNKMFGKWSLLSQTQVKREGALENETAADLPAGNFTFFVDPPDGATSTLRLYRGSELLKSAERPQISFSMQDGESLKMTVNHIFNRVGMVSVDTDPLGVSFTLTGPNNQRYEGVSPASYTNVPEGQYKADFHPPVGCGQPPPKSLFLEKETRLSFKLTLVCEGADRLRDEQTSPEAERFVNVTADGKLLVFRDVPQAAWFAPYVFNVARKEVLSGYKDSNGLPTGIFGPGNNVTVAELAKIAHKLAGIADADLPRTDPDNEQARGAWFSAYIASAEKLGWTIYSDAVVDPVRDATRGEVLVTLYQALDIPLHWQKGAAFTDVTARTPFAAAIETAAKAKIVSGKQDGHGVDTGLFGPMDSINRAEMAKIVDLAITKYKLGE